MVCRSATLAMASGIVTKVMRRFTADWCVSGRTFNRHVHDAIANAEKLRRTVAAWTFHQQTCGRAITRGCWRRPDDRYHIAPLSRAIQVALRFQPSWARTMLKPDIALAAPVQSFLKKVKKSLVTAVFAR